MTDDNLKQLEELEEACPELAKEIKQYIKIANQLSAHPLWKNAKEKIIKVFMDEPSSMSRQAITTCLLKLFKENKRLKSNPLEIAKELFKNSRPLTADESKILDKLLLEENQRNNS